jgi:hypothetical protein
MKPYGLKREDVTSLEWWAGSPTSTGNKTKSKQKTSARRTYKKIGRAKEKQQLHKEVQNIGI